MHRVIAFLSIVLLTQNLTIAAPPNVVLIISDDQTYNDYELIKKKSGKPVPRLYCKMSPAREKIEQQLDNVFKGKLPDTIQQGTPFADITDALNESGLTVLIDEERLSESGIGRDEEVSGWIRNLPLRDNLELLLANVGGVELTYLHKNGVLWITTIEHAEEVLETVLYEVRHLGKNLPAEDVRDVIQSSTSGPWFAIDGLGGTVDVIPGGLVIRQTQKVHREIDQLIEQLEAFTSRTDLPQVERKPDLPSQSPPASWGGKAGGGSIAPPTNENQPPQHKGFKRGQKGGT